METNTKNSSPSLGKVKGASFESRSALRGQLYSHVRSIA